MQQYLVGGSVKNGAPRNASGTVKNSIIDVLKAGPATATGIQEKLDFPKPTIYATLTHLIKERLVKAKKTDHQPAVYSWIGDKS